MIKHNFIVHSCREQLKEFADIHTKHERIAEMLPLPTANYIAAIETTSFIAETQKRYALLLDYKDNYLIDIAHQKKAVLVSNDKGFSFTKKLKRPPVEIISIQDLYRLLNL